MVVQTQGIVQRFNGRIEDVLQSYDFYRGENLELAILLSADLNKGQSPQSYLKGQVPINVLKDWHHHRSKPFRMEATIARDPTARLQRSRR